MAGIWQFRGKWKCQVRKAGFPSQSKTFDTKADATAWGTEVEAQMNRGAFRGSTCNQTTTVAEILNRYLAEESTRKAYPAADRSRAKPLIAALGAYHVHNLGRADLAQYKRARMTHKSAQTVTHELNLLHRAFVIAGTEWSLILPNGIPKTPRPRLPRGRGVRIRAAEIALIVGATQSSELKAIIPLAVETAMRRSELLGIRWEHVNMEM